MNHLDDLLSAYLDGELPWAERAEIASHLDDCSRCRNELAEIDAARAAVRSLPILETPAPAAMPVLSARRRNLGMRLAAVGAAAAAVLTFAVVGNQADEPPLDLEVVTQQHSVRASVDPGLIPLNAVSAVNSP